MLEEEIRTTQKAKLLELIKKSGAYDKKSGFVNLDTLWALPVYLKQASDCLEECLREYPGLDRDVGMAGLVCAVKPFGMLPILSLVSANLGLRLLVWKEGAARRTGESLIYPDSEPCVGRKAILVQDVTSDGMAAIKAAVALSEIGYKVLSVLTLVDKERGAEDYIKESVVKLTKQEIGFDAILKVSEIADYLSQEKE